MIHHDGRRLATTSALLTYWESIGVVCGHQVLADLGLGDTAPTIDLKELSNLLNDELNQSKDIIRWGEGKFSNALQTIYPS